MHSKRNFTLLMLLLLLLGCNYRKEHAVCFYYWKSQVDIGTTEKKYVDVLKAKTLYLRLFDVDDEGNGAIAKAKINTFNPGILNAAYVPVVFITNRTFVNKSEIIKLDFVFRIVKFQGALMVFDFINMILIRALKKI